MIFCKICGAYNDHKNSECYVCSSILNQNNSSERLSMDLHQLKTSSRVSQYTRLTKVYAQDCKNILNEMRLKK